MKPHIINFFLVLLSFFLLVLVACERPIDIELPDNEVKIVVEGYIENDSFPIILLSKSLPYLDPIKVGELGNLMIKGAKARIIVDGKDTVPLIEVTAPGGDPSTTFSIYTNPFLIGKVGSSYLLEVEAEGYDKISAFTTIPEPAVIDSFRFERLDSTNSVFLPENYDSLFRLLAYWRDPAGEANYYRYWTSRSSMIQYYRDAISPYTTNDNGVFRLDFFDGNYVAGAWLRGSKPQNDTTTNNASYFRLGDTVSVKFGCIDQAQYNFWDTYENNLQGQGPFSPPIIVKSNVKGGYGLWAGAGVRYYKQLVVK